MTWTIRPTAAVADPINPGSINVTFTAVDSLGSSDVVEISSNNAWTVEKEIAYRQVMLARLKARDAFKAAAVSFLPSIQAYIASNPAPTIG
jgi:hypothetical protein